jgi:hypothetical protein
VRLDGAQDRGPRQPGGLGGLSQRRVHAVHPVAVPLRGVSCATGRACHALAKSGCARPSTRDFDPSSVRRPLII